MIPLVVELVGAGALGVVCREIASRLWHKHQKPAQPLQDMGLYGIRVGVWIRTPDGQKHDIQSYIEQELARRGTVLFATREDPARLIYETGTWTDEIAADVIHIAVIGAITVTVGTKDTFRYPTKQGVHTPTGLRFDELDSKHPEYRKPNRSDYSSTTIRYAEEDSEFEVRREQERMIECTEDVETWKLNLRFYGPNGIVRGAFCNSQAMDEGNAAFISAGLADELSRVAKLALASSQISQSELELSKFQPYPASQ